LPSATGIEEHAESRRPSSRARRRIKERCPGVKISGGISNLSFSFRGNRSSGREGDARGVPVHAIRRRAGHGHRQTPASFFRRLRGHRARLLEHVEDVIFTGREDATERLVEYSSRVEGEATKRERDLSWRDASVRSGCRMRSSTASSTSIEEDTE